MSGLEDNNSQSERLRRVLSHWKEICRGDKEFVFLGDANICAFKWNDDNYSLSEHAGLVQEFLLETSGSQIVDKYTRSEVVRGGNISHTCIDHCYTNIPDKVSIPEVHSVGDSDHKGVVVTKYSRQIIDRPKTLLKRSNK